MKNSVYILLFIFYFCIQQLAIATSLDWRAKKPSVDVATAAIEKNLQQETAFDDRGVLRIAVASNFKLTAQHIADRFSHTFGIPVSISTASTATLYQQILHGAPFDVFLSADQQHVQQLIDNKKVAGHQGFVYAQGQLVFWQPDARKPPSLATLKAFNGRLAIANPKFAPYGIAAKQSLKSIEKWQSLAYVQGNNINQAYQFVATKHIPAGLVSFAAVIQEKQHNYVIIPQKWYQPIQQMGIILTDQRVNETALFRQFLLSKTIQTYIQSQGYH